MKGIDWGYGKIKGSVIRNAGYSFVVRYLSHSPGKNLTKEEYKDLKSADLDVCAVWETTTNRPLSGYDGGKEDSELALNQIIDITGSPQVIYFAVDADYNDNQLQTIGEYFEGVAENLLEHQIGVYGGYRTIEYILGNHLATYGWQTYAWSHGLWNLQANIRQVDIYGNKLNGVDFDINESITDEFGQF